MSERRPVTVEQLYELLRQIVKKRIHSEDLQGLIEEGTISPDLRVLLKKTLTDKEELFASFFDCEEESNIHLKVINGLIDEKSFERAREEVKKIHEIYLETQAKISRACSENHDIDLAHQVAMDIEDRRVRGNAVADIIRVLVEKKDLESALKMADDIKADSRYCYEGSLELIGKAFVEVDNLKAAREIAAKIEDPEKLAPVLIKIAEKTLEDSDLEAALNAVDKITYCYYKPSFIARINLIKIAKISEGLNLNAVLKITDEIQNVEARNSIFSKYSSLFCAAEEFETGWKLAKKISNSSFSLKKDSQLSIINHFIEGKDLERALELASEIESSSVGQAALGSIARSFADIGDISRARAIARRIKKSGRVEDGIEYRYRKWLKNNE